MIEFFGDPNQPCQWCGETHDRLCPYVKAVEFFVGGTVRRVEFLTPVDFPAKRTTTDEPRDDYPKYRPKGEGNERPKD